MSQSVAVLGKAGVGKTFVAAHLAMAFGYFGDKTLLVGCDQKRDTTRAVSPSAKPSLVELLEENEFTPERVSLADCAIAVTEQVDVMELGPSQLLFGDYGEVLEASFRFFDRENVEERYARIIYDLNDERFDGALTPLFQRVESALGVTNETAESLFVLNRLLRAALIGAQEQDFSLQVTGVINSRSIDPEPFENYVEQSKCFPLLTVPENRELGRLRALHRTLLHPEGFSVTDDPLGQKFLQMAGMLRGSLLTLYPVTPLEDEKIWELVAPPPPTN